MISSRAEEFLAEKILGDVTVVACEVCMWFSFMVEKAQSLHSRGVLGIYQRRFPSALLDSVV